MIMAQQTPWSDSSVKGCKKFLDRVAGLTDILSEAPVSDELEMKISPYHQESFFRHRKPEIQYCNRKSHDSDQ